MAERGAPSADASITPAHRLRLPARLKFWAQPGIMCDVSLSRSEQMSNATSEHPDQTFSQAFDGILVKLELALSKAVF